MLKYLSFYFHFRFHISPFSLTFLFIGSFTRSPFFNIPLLLIYVYILFLYNASNHSFFIIFFYFIVRFFSHSFHMPSASKFSQCVGSFVLYIFYFMFLMLSNVNIFSVVMFLFPFLSLLVFPT